MTTRACPGLKDARGGWGNASNDQAISARQLIDGVRNGGVRTWIFYGNVITVT